MKKKMVSLAIATGLVICSVASAQSSDAARAVVTVEKMLQIDARQAEIKFIEEAAKAGVFEPEKKEVIISGPKPMPVWAVRSIYGTGDNLFADIVVDGVVHQSMGTGSSIGRCKIGPIQKQCVALQPPSDKKGKPVKGLCPTVVCWSGDELAAEMKIKPGQDKVGLTPGLPAASPIPIPAGSVSAPAPLPIRR